MSTLLTVYSIPFPPILPERPKAQNLAYFPTTIHRQDNQLHSAQRIQFQFMCYRNIQRGHPANDLDNGRYTLSGNRVRSSSPEGLRFWVNKSSRRGIGSRLRDRYVTIESRYLWLALFDHYPDTCSGFASPSESRTSRQIGSLSEP